MRGLLLRLYESDPDAGASLRLIEYFDELLANRASIDAIVRATAMIAECTAGLRDDKAGHVVRIDLHGMRSPVASDPVVAERPVIVDGAPVGRVWLERDTAHGLDEMVIERMELTVAARWAARSLPARPTDVALVELLISERSNEEDRHRAVRLLGLQPDRPIRVLAARAATGMGLGQAVQDAFAGLGRSTGVARAVVVAERAAIVYQSAQSLEEVIELAEKDGGSSLHLGIGPKVGATHSHESWAGANIALRFVSVWPRVAGPVAYEELGSVAALAAVPRDIALANRDVGALEGHAARPSGRLDVETLLSFIRDGSLRTAAAGRHMHHSSIANRLRHVEQALGVTLDDPAGRVRAHTAAILWGLNHTEAAPTA